MTPTPVCIQTPKFGVTTPFASTYTPNTLQSLYAAGANGSKVTAVMGVNTDTSARIAQLWLVRSATNYLIGSCSIPANSGSDGSTSGTNLLSTIVGLPQDNDAQNYILLQPSDTLEVSLTTAPASGKNVYVNSIGGDF